MSEPAAATWQVRVRWGKRRLHAETLDSGGRRELTIGPGKTADVALGFDVHVHLKWTELGLQVSFSPGVTGSMSRRGDEPRDVSTLLARGTVKDLGDRFTVLLEPTDSLTLRVQTLTIDLRTTPVGGSRLRFDYRVLTLLAILLLALGSIVFAVSRPTGQVKARLLNKPRP